MNTTSCPPGLASDYVPGGGWPASPIQPSCELSYNVVVALLIILILIRCFTLYLLIRREIRKNAYLRSQPGRAHESKRFPLVPLIALLMAVLYTILLISIVTESMYSHAVTFFIFVWSEVCFSINAGLHLRKLEHIGIKLAGNDVIKLNETATRGGDVVFYIQIVCIVMQCCTVVAALVVPHSRIPYDVQNASFAIFLALHAMRTYLHHHRVLQQLVQLRVQANTSAAMHAIDRQRTSYWRENIYGTALTIFALIICVIQIFIPSFWFLFILMAVETTSVAIIFIVQFAAAMARTRHQALQGRSNLRSNTGGAPVGSFADMLSKARQHAESAYFSTKNDTVMSAGVVSQGAEEILASNQRFLMQKQDSLVEVNLQAVLDQAQDADVVEDNRDADVSILTSRNCPWSDSNTLFFLWFGFVPVRLLTMLNVDHSPIVAPISLLGAASMSTVLLGLVITGVIPAQVALLHIPIFMLLIVALLAIIDYHVAIRLVRSPWFAVRLATNIVAVGFVCDVWGGDVRSALAPFLLVGSIGAYLLDALVPSVASSKAIICASHLVIVAVLAILLQFDLVYPANNHVLHLTPTATYSLYQLARDLCLSATTFAAFELYDIWKYGVHFKRLTHVGNPVVKLVKKYDGHDNKTAGNVAHIQSMRANLASKPVGASQLQVRGGFFVHQDDTPSTMAAATADPSVSPSIVDRVVVIDSVMTKEIDSMACVVLGVKHGMVLFRFANNKIMLVTTWAPFLTLLVLINVIVGFAPIEFSFIVLPVTILWVIRQCIMLSRSVVILLLRRGEFWVSQFFLVVWLVLILIVLPHDGRLCIVFQAFAHAFLEALDDAHLSERHNSGRKVARVLERLVMAAVFLLLGWEMLLRNPAVLGGANGVSYVVNFRPDLTGLYENRSMAGQVDFSDEPAVLDVVQSTGDLTTTLGLRYFFATVSIVRTWHSNHFVLVRTPIKKVLVA